MVQFLLGPPFDAWGGFNTFQNEANRMPFREWILRSGASSPEWR